MRTAALAQRLAETLTTAVEAAARFAEDLLAAPRPEARLVPVRVRPRTAPPRR